jgi:hypothetical protein
MRIALLTLLFANVAFFAWAAWIDVPPAPRAAPAAARQLPRLALVTEVAATTPPRQDGTPPAQPITQSAPRCASVGPFVSPERAEQAMAVLRERGYVPRQQAAPGETWDGYWVYVGNLNTAAEEARVVLTLSQAGLTDARVMPESEAGRRISVGLFSERQRAERRARALRRLGLEPQIGERRVPGTVYWLELEMAAGDTTLSTEGLLSPDAEQTRLEVRACPSAVEG